MSNDHYYVVIVPHADQAAQALRTTRVAVGTHAPAREPASQRGPVGKPHSERAPAGMPASARGTSAKSASKRASARTPASSKHAASAPHTPKRVDGGYVGGTDHHLRTWSVVVGDDKYNVHDFGTACGYRIDCEGTTVWTGVLGRRGQYDTHTTTLAGGTLKEVLRLVYVGDQRHAQPSASQRTPAAPPSARRAKEPKATRAAKPTATASERSPAAPPSTTRRKDSTAKPAGTVSPPKSVTPSAARTAKPAAKRQATSAASSSQRSPVSTSSAKTAEKPKAKRQAKPRKALESTHAGPQTQRTPVSQASVKPSSRRAASDVDDAAVLKEIKANLHQGDPSSAEQHFQVMKAIWMRGGREAAIAWKAQHAFSNVVDAFDDWMEKNVATARAMLGEQPPPSAQKHGQVA